MGLAWTALGGSTLYVEAASVEKGEGKGSLKATGQCCNILEVLIFAFRSSLGQLG